MDDGKREQEKKRSWGKDEYRGEAYAGPPNRGSAASGSPAGDSAKGSSDEASAASAGAEPGGTRPGGIGPGIMGPAVMGSSVMGPGIMRPAVMGPVAGARTGGAFETGGGKVEYTAAASADALSWAQEAGAAVFDDEHKRDPEAEFLANAARRAHDEELAALASLALIRSGMAQRGKQQSGGSRKQDQPPTQEELNERLRRILEDTDVPPSIRRNR